MHLRADNQIKDPSCLPAVYWPEITNSPRMINAHIRCCLMDGGGRRGIRSGLLYVYIGIGKRAPLTFHAGGLSR